MYNPSVPFHRQIYRTKPQKTLRIRRIQSTVRSEPKRFLQRAARLFGCAYCGERDGSCLSFYMYTNGKIKAIRIRHCRTLQETKQELRLGFVLCKNCHKKRTASYAAVPSWLRLYKMKHGCSVCKINDADVLEFHHDDQSRKHFDISKNRYSVPEKVMNNELRKVIVLCSNCHAKEHSYHKT